MITLDTSGLFTLLNRRDRGLVLSFDERDFGVVAREGTIQLLPG